MRQKAYYNFIIKIHGLELTLDLKKKKRKNRATLLKVQPLKRLINYPSSHFFLEKARVSILAGWEEFDSSKTTRRIRKVRKEKFDIFLTSNFQLVSSVCNVRCAIHQTIYLNLNLKFSVGHLNHCMHCCVSHISKVLYIFGLACDGGILGFHIQPLQSTFSHSIIKLLISCHYFTC